MKRLFLLFLIGLAVALLFSFAVSSDPGYVRISIGHWLIESNLWIALTVLLVTGFVLFVLFILATSLIRSGARVGAWMGNSGAKKAHKRTGEGLLAYLEGNWQEAEKLLGRSASQAERPLINYLAAAHAAIEQGQSKEAEQLLKSAYDADPGSEFAIGITQAQFQFQQNQLEQCLASLVRLRQQKPHHPLLLRMLKTVYLKLEDWQQLIDLLPYLKKLPRNQGVEFKSLERQAWIGRFKQEAEKLPLDVTAKDHDTDALARIWKKMPDGLRFQPEVIQIYATSLNAMAKSVEAESLLRKTLNKNWSDSLVDLYGITEGKNASEQLITAENWLKERPNNGSLLLCLGRLALRNELWGKALEYFNASQRLAPRQETMGELCRLYLSRGDKESMQTSLDTLLDTMSLPALPQPGNSGSGS